jgi:RHS repeat-associated protein
VNSVPTQYTLDLAAGLTQVLDDETNAYLYGVGRIGEEQPDGWQYYLGDALGSVRQLTDEAGEITLAKSYLPYGEAIDEVGSAASTYGYTGEWVDEYTNLVFLRARWYAPETGRFTQIDPSRQERNLYLYTNSNPVNHTDPTGLFSPEQIASSMEMGTTSFDVVMQALYLTQPPPLLPDDNKWGFFSALLDAKDGDSLQAGSLVLMTTYPHIQFRARDRVWLKDCKQIMVGSRTLADFFSYVLLQPTIRDLPAEYWRDTSPSYYQLSGNNTVSMRYIDGEDAVDLPDFHSVDISIPGIIASGNAAYLVDRFGNQYISAGPSVGLGTGGISYSEGYICPNANSPDCIDRFPSLTDDSDIKNILVGPCVNVGFSLDLGGMIFACRPVGSYRGGGVIYSFGVNASIGAGGTWTQKLLWNSPSMGWNWAIDDRINGVDYVDVIVKSKANR